MDSSRRDLFNDVAQLLSILKKYQNTNYPCFIFTPKTGIELPDTGVLFLLCVGAGSGTDKNDHKSA